MTPRERVAQIIEEEAGKSQVPVEWVTGRKRKRAAVTARRRAIISIMEEFPRFSLPQVAGFFGKDPTTVVYHLGRLRRKPWGV